MCPGRTLLHAALLWASVAAGALAQTSHPSYSEPALSPDGHEIAFVSGGDIWAVPSTGGDAHLLISHPATESRPMYSPDGSKLAFISNRTGGGNIYVLTLATGDLARITYSDLLDQMDGWSSDGRWIYFTSAANEIGGLGDIFRVSSAGGTPLEVSRERYLNEFEAAPSPDGQAIALVAKGISNRQWWRNGHSHIDETELWLKPVAEAGRYQRLLPADAKHAWPMWSANGRSLFYMSDASGAENLWSMPVGAASTQKQLTHFKSGRVLWPSIGDGGKTIVFERNFAIWKMDTASGKAEAVPIQLRGLPASPGVTHLVESSFSRLALSPDGAKMALIAHGEVFAASAKDGGEAQRISHTAAAERSPVWSPDSLKLAYVSDRLEGGAAVFEYDFLAGKETALTDASGEDTGPKWSPDGKSIAYIHNANQLHVLTLAAAGAPQTDKVVASGALDREGDLAWSPDSQWIAFTLTDRRSFNNLHVVQAAGGDMHAVTFLANGETGSEIAWSPDGRYLLFDTAQRSEQTQIARVDLLPHVPRYREDEFRELFRPTRVPGVTPPGTPGKPDTPPVDSTPATATPAPAAGATANPAPPAADKKKPEPVRIVFDGIRERLTLLPLGLSADSPVISPDGKVLLFSARSAGQQSLYTYSLDELAKEPPFPRQLTSTPGSRSDFVFAPDSKEVVYLENGVPHSIAVESRTPKTIATTAPMDVNFDTEKVVVFDEAWSALNREFFDPKFNGRNWRGLHDEWAPYIAGTRTPDELRRDINLMIGELNASHSGIASPRGRGAPAPSARVGNLGLRFDREAYEAGRGLVVREVIALGPAAIEGTIRPGDVLVSVNGEAVTDHTNLDALLLDQVSHRVVLGMRRERNTRDAVVLPVSTTTAIGLLYRQWVNERRAYVDRISNGKIGYVHIADMSDNSLRQLYLDLDAGNESRQGVVVDVRNNNGGYVNGYVLDVFTRRNYLMMTPRDLFPMPSRQSLGQRALGLPTVLVTNESSLSDAEDFTEGYRSLGLGKVVGVPTAGWIIFTSGTELIDGSALRLPETRIQDLRGDDMEMHPRPVDVEVERPLGETLAGSDAQLERAVQELLQGH